MSSKLNTKHLSLTTVTRRTQLFDWWLHAHQPLHFLEQPFWNALTHNPFLRTHLCNQAHTSQTDMSASAHASHHCMTETNVQKEQTHSTFVGSSSGITHQMSSPGSGLSSNNMNGNNIRATQNGLYGMDERHYELQLISSTHTAEKNITLTMHTHTTWPCQCAALDIPQL